MKIFNWCVLVVSIGFTACSSYSDLKTVSWLLGEWEGRDSLGVVFTEHWKMQSPSSYSNDQLAIDSNGDTLFKETVKIDLIDGVPYYVTTVPKKSGAVLFRLLEMKKSSIIFENREYEFPQRISYVLQNENQLNVRLDGSEKGQPKSERISFCRNGSALPKAK
jgi:hypothetical protein